VGDFKRSWRLRHGIHREVVYRPLKFQTRSQLFIGANNESPPLAVRVNDPDCSAFGIDG
jgi:hypothetical protein